MNIKNDPRLCPLFSFHSLSRTVDELAALAFKDCDVSAAHGHLILVIIGTPRLNLSELSEVMNLKPSTMTRFIDKLQTQGLVKRINDGRKVRIEATQKGLALEDDITRSIQKLRELYIERFGEPLAQQIFNLCASATNQLNEKSED